jgi:hypothetical protein
MRLVKMLNSPRIGFASVLYPNIRFALENHRRRFVTSTPRGITPKRVQVQSRHAIRSARTPGLLRTLQAMRIKKAIMIPSLLLEPTG